MVASVRDGKLIAMEGDYDHIVNRGSLCVKGISMFSKHTLPNRLANPLYRAPGSDHWEEIVWEDAVERIAQKIRKTRDATWVATEKVGTKDVGYSFYHAPEFARFAVSVDAGQAGCAVVVSRDACLFLLVFYCCRNFSGHPCGDVDSESLGKAAQNVAARSDGTNCVLVAFDLSDFPSWRHGLSKPVRQRSFWKHGILFASELVFGGIVPLALLARAPLRARPPVLFLAALLATLGVILNRTTVVILAMNLKGPMPQIAPESYSPTVFEWGVSIGLIAATIFLFGLGARLFPLLPKEETRQG